MPDVPAVRGSEALSLLAEGLPRFAPTERARARFASALSGGRYLPFCAELAGHFALAADEMRALLSRLDDPGAWTRGVLPIEGHLHFRPGAELGPLRGGFVRMSGGTHFPLHRHTDRELTFVLEGQLVDDAGRRYAAGDAIDMPEGSVHALGVPPGARAVVALLHRRIEMLGG